MAIPVWATVYTFRRICYKVVHQIFPILISPISLLECFHETGTVPLESGSSQPEASMTIHHVSSRTCCSLIVCTVNARFS